MSWLQDQFNNFKDYNDKEYVQFNKEFADIEKQFVSIKDDNAKKWMEYSKEYSEVMELLLAKHNEINELRDQVKSLEGKIKEDEDNNCDNFYTVHSQINALNGRIKKNEEDKVKADKYCLYDEVYGIRARVDALDCKVKRNEEDTYKIIKDNEKYFRDQVNSLRAINKKLTIAVEENKEMINEIRTEMSNKEEKEEND